MNAGRRSAGISPIGAFAALTLLGLVVIERNLTSTSSWIATHLLFSYQDGFRRRALVGTLVQHLLGTQPVTQTFATALGLSFLVLFVLLAGLLTTSALRARADRALVILPLGVLLVASTHTRALVLDNGRFDVLLLSITLLVALIALHRPMVAAVVVGPLAIIALAVHEIALLAVIPLVFAMVRERLATQPRRAPAGQRILAAGASGAGAFAGWLILTGRLAEEVARERVTAIARRATFPPTDEAVSIHSASSAETILMTLAKVAEVGPVPLLALIAVSVPLAWLAVDAMVRPGEDKRPWGAAALLQPGSPIALMVASASPLLLMFLGVDHGRWFVLAALNLVIAAIFWQALHSPEVDASEQAAPAGPKMLVLLLFAVLIPSPIRGTIAIPGVTTSSGQIVRDSLRELLALIGA
jgi:hypothetical protein